MEANLSETKESRFVDYLQRVAVGPRGSRDLSRAEAADALTLILEGSVSDVRAAVFLIAMRMKRETLDENRGLLDALRGTCVTARADVERIVDIGDPPPPYILPTGRDPCHRLG